VKYSVQQGRIASAENIATEARQMAADGVSGVVARIRSEFAPRFAEVARDMQQLRLHVESSRGVAARAVCGVRSNGA